MNSSAPPHFPHFPHAFQQVHQGHKHRPAKWCHDRRKWVQDGRILQNVKASKAFVWPKDGRNDSTWGRFKDILQSKGPDMFVTMGAEKHDIMYNRPARADWAGWYLPGDMRWDSSSPFSARKHAPWTSNGLLGGRKEALPYDFRTRQYAAPNRRTWTNAIWQPEPRLNKSNPYPDALRDIAGRWFQDEHYVPHAFGGPFDNERGRGSWSYGVMPSMF
jgi:hypothetical protein